MDTPFYLKCLGQPALLAPNGDVIRFRTRKHLALLVFLGSEPRTGHRRDRLADLLWSSATEAEARHSLATALSIIRSKLGADALECSRDHVRLAPACVTTDLARLSSGDIFGDDGGEMLDVAGFLEGFEVADAVEFMLWKDRQQARWLPAIRDALVRLMDRCRRTGDFTQAERVAERMLVLDELSEDAIRAKMEARAFAGDRLTALRIFEVWKEDLARELGAVPSPLVEGMALRLRRRGWERTAPSRIPNVPTDHWKGRVFIGRRREYRVLYEGWERMQRGEVGHALVAGDSGIGKSTLVERFTTAAALEGAAVTRVQCYEPDRGIPYGVVGLLVPPLLDRPGASATPPEALAELARTVPEVRRRYPAIPEAADSQGETARLRLAEALHELLRAVAEEHPVIAVVDDLHHADDVSLAVLHLVIRKSRGEPILIVFTVRPGELVQSPQAHHLLERAAALDIRRIDVPPLTEAESEQAISGMVGPDRAPPGAAVRRALVRAAAGYPMVLELLVEDWIASGDQCLAVSVGAMTAELAASGGDLPSFAYRVVLERLLHALGPTGRNVVNLAAILGHRLNDLAMYALVDLTIGQTMTGFAELVERRVLRDGGQRLEFVNELVRAHVYLAVPSPLRKALHGQIADRLIEQEGRGEKVPGLETAWHCIRAGRRTEAPPYLLRGGREAVYAGAPNEAELALRTGMPELAGTDRACASLILAEAHQEQGAWSESVSALDQADFELGEHKEQCLVLKMVASRHLGLIPPADIPPAIRQLAALVERATIDDTKAGALYAAARLLGDLPDRAQARALQSLATSIRTDVLSDAAQSQLLLALAILAYFQRDRTASLNYVTSAADEMVAHGGANSTLTMLRIGLSALKCSMGAYADALTECEKAHALALRLSNNDLVGQAAANASTCFGRLGDYEKQILWSTRAIEVLRHSMVGGHVLQAARNRAMGFALTGKSNEATDAIRSIEANAIRLGGWIEQAYYLYCADTYMLTGRVAEAVKWGRRGTDEKFGGLQFDTLAGPYSRWIAIDAYRGSGQDRASTALGALMARIDEFDALDQIEILISEGMLRTAGTHEEFGSQFELRKRVAAMPAAVLIQLERVYPAPIRSFLGGSERPPLTSRRKLRAPNLPEGA